MRHPSTVAVGRRRHGSTALLIAALTLAVLVPSCSKDPSLANWERGWQQTLQSLPPLSTVMAGQPGETCSATLGMLREPAADLTTAPNEDLADAFLSWSSFTEGVFFECPPVGGAHAGFEASYEEIARLSSEVDALLAFEHDLLDGQ
ncbi:MAG: hypothetical protein MUP76_03375 [Acidimicrobiia bacterium]|nr:hypothetical protein [Acidimicrobiia bacterium]